MTRRELFQHFAGPFFIPKDDVRKPVEGARLCKVLGYDAWLVNAGWPLPRWVNLGDCYSDTMNPVGGCVIAEVT